MIDRSLFDGMAMDFFGDARATVTPRLSIQIGFAEGTRVVAASAAATGDASLELRSQAGEVIQGDLPRGVRVLRGAEVVFVATAKSSARGDRITVRGAVLLDVAAGDVLDLTPPVVELECYERGFDIDDKANSRINFNNLHISRDEARRQRIALTAEVIDGDVRNIREGALFRYEEDDFVYAGVVRSADRRGRRYVDLEVEVEEDGA